MLIKAGGLLLLASLGGFTVSASYRSGDTQSALNFDTGAGTPAAIGWTCFGLAVLLLLVGLALLVHDWRHERIENERRTVLVVEQRGLLKRTDAPLLAAVPGKVVGRRVGHIIDHTHFIQDGVVVDPARALDEVRHLRRDVQKRVEGVAPEDVAIVYGGVSPVPLTFLAGALLDDEGMVTLMDWDRHGERWRALDGEDDGERFMMPNLDVLPEHPGSVSLAISVSYRVDEDGVRQVSNGDPVLLVALEHPVPGNHWSETKQEALAKAFTELLVGLGNRGVKRVNLFLAAPNSVSFRFGRSYDGRNMPGLTVHQYEKSGTPSFPWGITVPHHGYKEPSLDSYAKV